MKRRYAPGPLGLLVKILTGTPHLPGALCKGRSGSWDGHDPDRPTDLTRHLNARAIAECQQCPALTPCRAWVESLPLARRPTGVVAGIRINDNRKIKEHHQP